MLAPLVPSLERPRTRGECIDGARPCPWVSCRHHLALYIDSHGRVRLTFPEGEPDETRATCALDAADEGAHTLDEVAVLLNCSRERVRQIEIEARARMLARGEVLGGAAE
jgi:hypothetical protein